MPTTGGTMAGKTVLVTGGTGGIGKATAAGVARLGVRVGIVGRDWRRAEAAAVGIRRGADKAVVDLFVADMSSQAEVRRLAADVLDRATRHTTADRLEHTFAVNHLAPFLLTNLLLERLKGKCTRPDRYRLIRGPRHGAIDFDDLQAGRNYQGQHAYDQSKLANVMFTYELARRLEGTGVTANVLHPGVVRTRFAAEDRRCMRGLIPIARLFMKTPERGAATPVYLASSPEVEGVTGRYFVNSKSKRAAELSATPMPRRACGASARNWSV